MSVSVTDIFSIGIGPSSSHTVGPMRAAKAFIESLNEYPAKVTAELRGSLSATGKGHATDRATILGLVGWDPLTVPLDAEPVAGMVPSEGHAAGPAGELDYEITWNNTPVPEHPNCVIFNAYSDSGETLAEHAEYFSVGGGFILSRAELDEQLAEDDEVPAGAAAADTEDNVPYEFSTADELMEICRREDKKIWEIVLANEDVVHRAEGGKDAVLEHLDKVWDTMQECVRDGISTTGTLPGGLEVPRRAPQLHQKLLDGENGDETSGFSAMEWVNLYALAVNEQNAAGGRVVTAPTNGACGIIPAVMHYARDFVPGFDRDAARRFMLTAGAVGIVIKTNASISGAEVGCQGEVGSASAMAAAGLAHILGCTPAQVENAAEIALEHNLGLTCDPVGGLVQVPCIERNAIGGVKSINAARLAKMGGGTHFVSLDNAIETMADTGRDMMAKYKETSMGGLAKTMGFKVSQVMC
ncbi:L-serine ammonia-lyase [Corynebacterium massiliense]|uniref:L-serine dehydratase n=1 Tax=Corynebacterium massiliense DSM 45435 TaxID=1121364 RepID=A0ABY7U891_9CORY|nr:L-serine ammonia-lyase [Corynebacterium massiliense]WCZ32606.1 L-serine dehydratase 1 [Corynebacterium massiliense DSM 45435]